MMILALSQIGAAYSAAVSKIKTTVLKRDSQDSAGYTVLLLGPRAFN
jgi:hypothetical protein